MADCWSESLRGDGGAEDPCDPVRKRFGGVASSGQLSRTDDRHLMVQFFLGPIFRVSFLPCHFYGPRFYCLVLRAGLGWPEASNLGVASIGKRSTDSSPAAMRAA